MITITDKTKCCGCGACFNICPKHCITMRADAEGFLYPSVDKQNCVNCGLCEKVCPVLHVPSLTNLPQAYAAKNISDEIKLKSSSGGMFTALAEYILARGGVVFGAGFDKNWNVCHQYAETIDDLDKLRRSKYVQSDIGHTFEQAKNFLQQSREVLFTGTPCQIAGLKNYLGKDYANLLTADIICHATPSPNVWQKFLTQNFTVSQIRAINFREKHFDWTHFYLSFLMPHALCAHGNVQTINEKIFFHIRAAAAVIYRNCFLKAFLQELINRPSCHVCQFKGQKRAADFTLGDLWGKWDRLITNEDRRYGISALLVNSTKGRQVLSQIKAISITPVDLEQVARFNSALRTSTKAHPRRKEFFSLYDKTPLKILIPRLLGEKPLVIQIPLSFMRKVCSKLYRLLLHK